MKQANSPRSQKPTERYTPQGDLPELMQTRPEQGMAVLFEQYHGYCCKIAYEILRCWEDAEECANDALLLAGKAMRTGAPHCLRAYLAATARNQAVSRYRKEHCEKRGGLWHSIPLREAVCRGTEVLEETVCSSMLIRQCVETVLREYTPRDRRLFLRRYEDGLSIGALAAEFSLSEPCVRSRLYRMRSRLRLELRRCEL